MIIRVNCVRATYIRYVQHTAAALSAKELMHLSLAIYTFFSVGNEHVENVRST